MNKYEPQLIKQKIYSLLNRIGITSNYTGYYYIAYAVLISLYQPRRIVQVTKWIYPAVAKHYSTSSYAVERNIRTIVDMVWLNHREVFESIFKIYLKDKPGNAQFLAIITMYIISIY